MEKQGKFIRGAVVGLPVGLFVLGVASMLYTHFKPERPEFDPDYQKRMDAASLNRKAVNRPDLERFVRILSEEIGERHLDKPAALDRTAIWIQSTLKGGNFGYQVKSNSWTINEIEVRNLTAELLGTEARKEVIIVGAHYDTVKGCPGANSGGTGVAAVLALAQAFAGDPKSRTIRFAFFVNEEEPWFQTDDMGSLVYTKSRSAKEEKIVGVLNIDSIGCFASTQSYPDGLKHNYPATGDFIAFIGDEVAKFRADSAKSIFTRVSGINAISGQMPWLNSDQWSFAKYHFPAVLVTDTAQYRDPHFHKSSDTMEKIDFDKFEKTCRALKQIVEVWATP